MADKIRYRDQNGRGDALQNLTRLGYIFTRARDRLPWLSREGAKP